MFLGLDIFFINGVQDQVPEGSFCSFETEVFLCAKLNSHIVATAMYGRTAISFSADARAEMSSAGSEGIRPGSVGSTKALLSFADK